jgi:hypothetical protein
VEVKVYDVLKSNNPTRHRKMNKLKKISRDGAIPRGGGGGVIQIKNTHVPIFIKYFCTDRHKTVQKT